MIFVLYKYKFIQHNFFVIPQPCIRLGYLQIYQKTIGIFLMVTCVSKSVDRFFLDGKCKQNCVIFPKHLV